jgi:AcrR family transcriptional regulator
VRRDAQRNHERIVVAAREVFDEQGIDAPIRDIADRAGVGVATLYRRFPERERLVEACFRSEVAGYLDALEAAGREEDAWQGFVQFVERVCEMQAEDEGFSDVLSTEFPAAEWLRPERERAYELLEELLRRAQEQGAMRAGIVPTDMGFVIWAFAGYLSATRRSTRDGWRRYAAILLDGLRAEATTPLPPAVVTEGQLLSRQRKARGAGRAKAR